MFLPNMVVLLGRLVRDSRVPAVEKALFFAAIVYVISPLDFIPDVFPFIGQVDDLYVVALVLLRLISKTDESVVRQHWTGGGGRNGRNEDRRNGGNRRRSAQHCDDQRRGNPESCRQSDDDRCRNGA